MRVSIEKGGFDHETDPKLSSSLVGNVSELEQAKGVLRHWDGKLCLRNELGKEWQDPILSLVWMIIALDRYKQ